MKDQIIEYMGLTDYEEFDKYLIVRGLNAGGKPTCQIYNTNVKKLHKCKIEGFYYSSIESREQRINNFKERVNQTNEEKNKKLEIRRTFKNPAQVGDILVDSWGYDQTNIDFYQVTEVKGKMVTVQEIAGKTVEGTTYSHGMADEVVPVKDRFVKENVLGRKIMNRLVKPGYNNGYFINTSSYSIASLTDQKEKHYRSWYA